MNDKLRETIAVSNLNSLLSNPNFNIDNVDYEIFEKHVNLSVRLADMIIDRLSATQIKKTSDVKNENLFNQTDDLNFNIEKAAKYTKDKILKMSLDSDINQVLIESVDSSISIENKIKYFSQLNIMFLTILLDTSPSISNNIKELCRLSRLEICDIINNLRQEMINNI